MSAIGPGQAHDFNIYVERLMGVSASSLSSRTRERIGEILREMGNAVEEVIFSVWPVDTGRSLRAWRVFSDPDDLTLHIENPVHYASWVHPAGTAGTTMQDELGESARAIKTEADLQGQQKAGRIRALLDAEGVEREDQPSLFGNLFGAAVRGAVTRAVAPDLSGTTFFQSLRSIYTMQRIAERERQRTRERSR